MFSLVLCEVALGAQQRRPRSDGARQDSRAAKRLERTRAESRPGLERTRARGTPGLEGLEPARLEPGSSPLGSCTTLTPGIFQMYTQGLEPRGV